MKRFENLEEAMCKELGMLDKKYGADSSEMTVQDLEKADKLYHALKSAETYYAMAEAAEWDEEEEGESGRSSYARGGRGSGRSYARGGRGSGRSYARGGESQYASRGMGYSGYDGYSGHYPEWMPPYYR